MDRSQHVEAEYEFEIAQRFRRPEQKEAPLPGRRTEKEMAALGLPGALRHHNQLEFQRSEWETMV